MDNAVKQVLRVTGLDGYAECFISNEIDDDVLADLTGESLKEMGVNPVGHRIKLLKAIRAVVGHRSVLSPYKFLGQHYFQPAQLAAAMGEFWDEGVKRIQRGSILEWARKELQDDDLTHLLEDIADDEDLNSNQKLAVALLAMDSQSSFSWRGEVISATWFSTHPAEGLELCESSAGIWLQRLRNDSWLQELCLQNKDLIGEIRALSLPLDLEKVALYLFVSRESALSDAQEVKALYVGASHPVLDALLRRNDLSLAEAIAVLSSDGSFFLTIPQTMAEEGLRSIREMGIEFDETTARTHLERANWDELRPHWEDKRSHFAASSHEYLNKLFEKEAPEYVEAVAIVTARDKYFWSVNSLGMPFVRIRGLDVRFCVWPTRVRDYEAFVRGGTRHWRTPDFEQSPDHPAVKISWNDATEFCQWLTDQERASGQIGPAEFYRLPSDLEWSAAAGLPPEVGDTPRDRHRSTKGHYPWGNRWPPPREAGNFSPSLEVDGFEYTSPVGSFTSNSHGLYDLGGNVWEWCLDSFDGQNGASSAGLLRVLRGASWFYGVEDYLLTSFRNRSDPLYNNGNIGFRCVLATS